MLDDPNGFEGLDDDGSADDLDVQALTSLLARARSAPTAEELSSEQRVLESMRAVVSPQSVVDLDGRRRQRRLEPLSKRVTRTAVVATVFLVGASTAAATGTLPDSARKAVSHVTSQFGLDLTDHGEPGGHTEKSTTQPSESRARVEDSTDHLSTETSAQAAPGSSDDTAASTTGPDPTVVGVVAPTGATTSFPGGTQPVDAQSGSAEPEADPKADLPGPKLDGPARKGLCKAWASHGTGSQADVHSAAMRRLEAAALAAGRTVEQFCDRGPADKDTLSEAVVDVTPDPTTSVDQRGKGQSKGKVDETKNDESKNDESKNDERKNDESKVDESKNDETDGGEEVREAKDNKEERSTKDQP